MNAAEITLKKFQSDKYWIKKYSHWCLTLRPAQVTLGSLVLICTENVENFSKISKEAFEEFQQVIQDTEKLLGDFVNFDKINYLMLMMVDPAVHFHVIPRYEGHRTWGGDEIADTAWPGPPDVGFNCGMNEENLAKLCRELRGRLK